jgi:hypothetical protein
MQEFLPVEMVKLIAAIGVPAVIRRSQGGTGPVLYAILRSPALGVDCSIRWRNSATQPERRGFLVYHPFPAERQTRHSRLSFEQALSLVGSQLSPEDAAKAADEATNAAPRGSDAEMKEPSQSKATTQTNRRMPRWLVRHVVKKRKTAMMMNRA